MRELAAFGAQFDGSGPSNAFSSAAQFDRSGPLNEEAVLNLRIQREDKGFGFSPSVQKEREHYVVKFVTPFGAADNSGNEVFVASFLIPEQGLRVGDKILAVNNVRHCDYQALVKGVQRSEDTLFLTVSRETRSEDSGAGVFVPPRDPTGNTRRTGTSSLTTVKPQTDLELKPALENKNLKSSDNLSEIAAEFPDALSSSLLLHRPSTPLWESGGVSVPFRFDFLNIKKPLYYFFGGGDF